MVETLAIIVVAQLVAFGVIVFVLKRILLNDTLNAVRRLREVEGDLARKEEAARRKIEEGERDLARRSQAAREEVERAREEMVREVDKQRRQILAEAATEKDKLLQEAKEGVERVRRELVQDVDKKAVEFASGLFELVLSSAMNDALHRRFLEELIEAIEEIDETSLSIDVSAVEFKAGQPLPEDVRKRLSELLAAKFGIAQPLEAPVAPELLAGLMIRLGDLEIDGTLRSRLRDGADELRRRHAF